MVGEQFEQVFVRCQVDDCPPAIVFDHLSSTPIGGDQHPGNLIGLHRLNEVAVAQGSRRIGRIGPIQEGRTHGNNHDHEQDVEPRIAPTLFQDPFSN